LKDITAEEKKMFRNLPEQEIINAMIGNVKVQGAGNNLSF
jgi:hypothetical protein